MMDPIIPSLQFSLAVMFVIAGSTKVAASSRLEGFIEALSIGASARSLGRTVSYLEIAVGIALAVDIGGIAAPVAALLASTTFVVIQVVALRRRISLDCGCFGGLDPEQRTVASVVRSFAVALLAAGIVLESIQRGDETLFVLSAPSAVTAVFGCAAATALILATLLLGHAEAFNAARPRAVPRGTFVQVSTR